MQVHPIPTCWLVADGDPAFVGRLMAEAARLIAEADPLVPPPTILTCSSLDEALTHCGRQGVTLDLLFVSATLPPDGALPLFAALQAAPDRYGHPLGFVLLDDGEPYTDGNAPYGAVGAFLFRKSQIDVPALVAQWLAAA